MKEQWDYIADPTFVKTILGLLPKYLAVDQLL